MFQGKSASIQGLKTRQTLRLIMRTYAVGQKPMKVENQFYDVFNGIGKLSTEYKIRMMKLNCPVISVPRNVPAALGHECEQVEQTPESAVCVYAWSRKLSCCRCFCLPGLQYEPRLSKNNTRYRHLM